MKKTWTAPTLQDFNVASRKRAKPYTDPDTGFDSVIPKPKSIDELSINPRKIAEVQRWAKLCIHEPSSVLLVSGPPGSGKTVTLKLIAEAEGLLVVEWTSPISKTIAGNVLEENGDKNAFYDYSEANKFEQFIIRSSRYPSLFEPKKRTMILVKDIPNAFIWKPELFHGFLERYKSCGKSPIAFIITDDDNLDLHGALFPNQLKSRLAINVIKFNPVSDTFLKKNLKILSGNLVQTNENLSAEFLEKIVERSAGDLNSAATAIFVELRTGQIGGARAKKKRKRNVGASSDDEFETKYNAIPSRDHGYDFYKKMGRILYPKRVTENVSRSNVCHLVHDFYEIAENWNNSYSGLLHENYLQTCSKLADAFAAADCFSFCDVLPRCKEIDKYLGLVTVSGLMTANTQPKKNGFLPFKKSVNLGRMKDWKCKFTEESVLKFGVEERIFALDVAPLKQWLPAEIDSSIRTLNCLAGETRGKFKSSQTEPAKLGKGLETEKFEGRTMDTSEEEEDEDVYDIEE